MCWKKMPSWLKGGVIAVILFMIPSLFEYSIVRHRIIPFLEDWLKIGTTYISDSGIHYTSFLSHYYYPLIIEIIIYFLIGAVIGLIIKKINSK
jgi:hypothetical protein